MDHGANSGGNSGFAFKDLMQGWNPSDSADFWAETNGEYSAAANQSSLGVNPGNSNFLSSNKAYHGPRSGHSSGIMERNSNSINYGSSQGASFLKLVLDNGDRDGIKSTYGANIEREEIKADSGVPRAGMEFDCEEAVYNFYSEYAKQKGFKVKKGNKRFSGVNNGVMRKCFLCSLQGRKSKKWINKPTQDTRRHCEAKIKCKVTDGKWKIEMAVLEHNHSLKGCLAGSQEGAEDSPARRVLSTGKNVDGLPLISNVDDVSQGTGNNSQDLVNHLSLMLMENNSFYYTLKLDARPGMHNFFWRDGQSMVDYNHFGDVLVLDTRTRINSDEILCAVLWGLNHHQQPIIFGWAILVDQGVSSFKWLLENFLKTMKGQKPQTIITEIKEEIAEALRMLLPETSHCLPYWSMLKSDQADVGNLFRECALLESPEEFASKWDDLVAKYNLRENAQVASLYEMREKWSRAFTKKVFSAGLLSMSINEDAHAVFQNPPLEKMTLSQILCRWEEVAKRMRTIESLEDEHCKNYPVKLKSPSPVEQEAQLFYTRPIFRMFQEELMKSLSLAEEKAPRGTISQFKLTERSSMKINIVEVDETNSTLACTCGKFESVGILCCHVLKALNTMNSFEIPPRYVLKRWMKSAKNRNDG